MKMKNSLKVVIFYVVLIVLILWATNALLNTQSEKINFSNIVEYFEAEQVDAFEVDDDNTLYLTLKPDENGEKQTIKYSLRSMDVFENYLGDTIREQYKSGIICL